MTKFIKITFLVLITYLPLKAQNAPAIFKKATSQLLMTDMELIIEVNEIKKNGRVTEKRFQVLIGTFDNEEKIKTKILKPERAKGIAIVLTKYPDKIGLIEIFTPANGKTRKMKATQKNIELVGSGALISNYISRNQAELNIRYIEKLQIDDKSYHKIEVKDKINNENKKEEFLIEEQTLHISLITTYDSNAKKESITKLSDFKKLGDKIHPKKISTEDIKNKNTTQIKVLDIKSIQDLKIEDFKTNTDSNN